MDMKIIEIVSASMMFADFKIFVAPEDRNMIENLRYNFDHMLMHVRKKL